MRILGPFSACLLSLALGACATIGPHHSSQPADSNASGEPAASALYRAIADRDAALSAAFNDHDVAALMALFDESLEFYHDTGGLQHHADVTRGFTNLLGQNNGIRRELVPGSLRVFPIANYGAVELGRHRFCHVENGKDDCGTFEFVQLWRQTDGAWKITRVVSYGH